MPPADPFAQLGLPRRFVLDEAAVQRAYLARCSALHPDLSPDDPDAEEVLAGLNEARRVLLDPESRADVLLVLLGGPTREAVRTLPAGFLQEMMQVRESVEEASASGDRARLAEWERWAQAERQRYIEGAAERFGKVEGGSAGAQTFAELREWLNAWRYIERLGEQIDRPPGAPGL